MLDIKCVSDALVSVVTHTEKGKRRAQPYLSLYVHTKLTFILKWGIARNSSYLERKWMDGANI
jgi:hypothetical protein